MQATELKTGAEKPIDIAADEGTNPQAAPTNEHGLFLAATEESCCAVPPRRLRTWPWLLAGGVLVPLALYAGWDWLAATGIATLLVVVAPCLLMCALGVCMQREKSKSGMSLTEIRKTYDTDSGEPGEPPGAR